jgi:hypothetical protein
MIERMRVALLTFTHRARFDELRSAYAPHRPPALLPRLVHPGMFVVNAVLDDQIPAAASSSPLRRTAHQATSSIQSP